MTLETYLLDTMFEQSLLSDLSLAFYHSAYPSTMRFKVHRAIVAQSSFLRLLLNNTHRINSVSTSLSQHKLLINNTSHISQQSHPNHSTTCDSSVLHLTIDIIDAMSLRGFLMAPSQHIIRRQWQTSTPPNTATATTEIRTNNNSNHTTRHILSSHIRFVFQWLYSTDRSPLVGTLKDDDVLRVLCVAILFDLDPLVDACLERYTNQQMSVHTIVGDLETIRELPRDHRAYHQLRDAALLLLFRFGPDHPQQIACLSVDYMVDVLGADVLFIGCEYERYRLLREVLVAYMKSVGKITWTVAGPLDQDHKRLSGFVHNPLFTQNRQRHHQQQQQQQQQHPSLESVHTLVSAQKRKLNESSSSSEISVKRVAKKQHLSRLSFSFRVPFEQFVEDVSSSGGGVIDKATILSYLLRTTVNYSNMTFEQLSIVRQDKIVDEGIVFRALWQREALERLLFPFHYEQSQQIPNIHSPSPSTPIPAPASSQLVIPPFRKTDTNNRMDRQESTMTTTATGTLNDQVSKDQGLLGAPRYRFTATVRLNLPRDGDRAGWTLEQHVDAESTTTTSSLGKTFSDISQQNSNTSEDLSIILDQGKSNDDDDNDNDNDRYRFDISNEDMEVLPNCDPTINSDGQLASLENHHQQQQQQQQQQQYSGRIYSKTVYTDATYILGQCYRVRLEAQVLPRCLLEIEDDDEDSGSERKQHVSNSSNNKVDSPVLVCRFELQRTFAVKPSTSSQQQFNNTQHPSAHSMIASQKSTQNISQSLNSSQRSITSRQPQQNSTTQSPIPNHGGNLDPLPLLPPLYEGSVQQKSKIRYAIYCLNQHEGLMKNDQVDPEDRVLVPVSEVVEGNQSNSYIGQVLLNTDALAKTGIIDVDMMVALEIFFTNKSS